MSLIATFDTERGPIRVELAADKAPLTVANFVNLAQRGFYDGLNFHRVINDFMVQGGCPLGTGTGGPGFTIKDELSGKKQVHKAGSLSMAKTAAPDSGGSQFFICHSPQPHLDRKHTVFGVVETGMDVVNKIRKGDKMNRVWIEET